MDIATPRVLPSHLHAFAPSAHPQKSTVRVLGVITTVSGDQATLTCGNDAVTILLNRDSHLSPNHMYEIVGKVINLEGGAGLGVKVLSSCEWPKNERGELPDVRLFEAVVDVTHKVREIFYEDSGTANQGDGGY